MSIATLPTTQTPSQHRAAFETGYEAGYEEGLIDAHINLATAKERVAWVIEAPGLAWSQGYWDAVLDHSIHSIAQAWAELENDPNGLAEGSYR
jgi:hypothetical protein